MSITALRIVTPPDDYPVTVLDAKGHLRVTHSADDFYIQQLIAAATSWAHDETRRILLSTVVTLRMDRFPASGEFGRYDPDTGKYSIERGYNSAARTPRIFLPGGNVTEVASIAYIDTEGAAQTLAGPTSDPVGTDYQEDLNNDEAAWLFPPINSFWPSVQSNTVNAVTVRYTVGFGPVPSDVPETIRHAIRLKIGDMYVNRDGSGAEALAAARLIAPYALHVI